MSTIQNLWISVKQGQLLLTERRRLILRYFVYMCVGVLLAGAQTSFWFHIFGSAPAPALWLCMIIFFSLYRGTVEGVLYVHSISFILSVFTSMPMGLFSLVNISVYLTARFVKSRVFGMSTIYYVSMCAISVPIFYFYQTIYSLLFETKPITDLEVLPVIVQTLFTLPAAFFLFYAFLGADALMRDDVKESWGGSR